MSSASLMFLTKLLQPIRTEVPAEQPRWTHFALKIGSLDLVILSSAQLRDAAWRLHDTLLAATIPYSLCNLT